PPVTHRRGILMLGNESWLVLDYLESSGPHSYRLHWLLQDAPYEWDSSGRLTLSTCAGPYFVRLAPSCGAAGYSLVRADESTPRGWWAPYYYDRKPALSLALTCQASSVLLW